MNNLSPLGLVTCFIFSLLLNGASFSSSVANQLQTSPQPYITNLSSSVVYYKPESRKDNPGLEPDGAYAIAPGASLYAPFDAIVTSTTAAGKIFRLPDGSRVVIYADGTPKPTNIIGRAATILPAYGNVEPPFRNFAKLANSKHTLYQMPDVVAKNF